MLSSAETERSRLFAVLDAEVKTKNPADRIPEIQESVYKYLLEKVPELPKDIFNRENFENESGIFSTQAIETSAIKLWSGRIIEPDVTVPGRQWSVELLIGDNGERVTFASRLGCFSRSLDFYFEPGAPRVYKNAVKKGILIGDGVKLSLEPRDVQDEDELDWLLALINNRNRSRNIIVLSCDSEGRCLLKPYAFTHRLCAIAHVVRIYPSAAIKLSRLVGKHFSVFDAGVRIYRPTPKLEADEPLRHPLYTKRRLQTSDPQRAVLGICHDAFRTSAEGGLRSKAVPSFIQVRSTASAFALANLQRSDHSAKLEDELKAALVARRAAEEQAKEALDIAVQEEKSRKEAEAERDLERSRAMAIAARVRSLEAKISLVPETRPNTYEELPAWIESQFASRLRLHPRALRMLQDAEFENISLVCDLIEMLAVDYVECKRGNRDSWVEFKASLAAKGVELSGAITKTRAGEKGDEYFVLYRGQRRLLEHHLKKGISRDKTKTLRIYFFWDEEDEEVIIGSLPSHLDTRET